jgi:hypothetical protein
MYPECWSSKWEGPGKGYVTATALVGSEGRSFFPIYADKTNIIAFSFGGSVMVQGRTSLQKLFTFPSNLEYVFQQTPEVPRGSPRSLDGVLPLDNGLRKLLQATYLQMLR